MANVEYNWPSWLKQVPTPAERARRAEAGRTRAEEERARAEEERAVAERRAAELAARVAAYERQHGPLPDNR